MAGRPLTFVHLSDIHFLKDVSDVSNYDLEKGLRHAVLRDLDSLRPKLNEFDGVLISGDIAFAGKVDEYERAVKWLNEICGVIKCDPGQIWCVPGNHDVDQSVQKTFATIVDSHAALRASNSLGEDLRQRLDNVTNGPLLFQPLQTYHEQFAVKYGCPTTCKEPSWEDTLVLNDGLLLRIRGINSAYCSSRADDPVKAPLIVGPMQTVFLREDNVVYLTLCHHPPDWVKDGRDMEQALNADAHIQLFGHKHFHEHRKVNNSIILSSGAVHPARSEQDWDPRYYVLSLEVKSGVSTDENRLLEVSLYPRVWDKSSRSFLADRGCNPSGAKVETIALPAWSKPVTQAKDSEGEESPPMAANRKKLLHQFMLLPYYTQLAILHNLNLFSEEEINETPDSELFIASFGRAKEKGVLEALWNAIESEAK